MLLFLSSSGPQISTHTILSPTSSCSCHTEAHKLLSLHVWGQRSLSYHLEAHKLLLLQSWAQQTPNPTILKPTSSCSYHVQAPKFLLTLSRVPQAPAHTILRHTNLCFCNPEVNEVLLLPSSGPKVPTLTIQRHIRYCTYQGFITAILRPISFCSCHPEGRILCHCFCHYEVRKVLFLSPWKKTSSCLYHAEVHKL